MRRLPNCQLRHSTTLKAGVFANDSHLVSTEGQWSIQGDPTEGALLVAAHKAGLTEEALERESPRLDTIPFESEYQYMATLRAAAEGAW
jgi:cation-transporting P-type ATPase F